MIKARQIRPADLVRLLNSTPLGPVCDAALIRKQRDRAGLRIGDTESIDMPRYAAWLFEQRRTRAAAEVYVESLAELAARLGLNIRSVERYSQQGMPGERGKWPLVAAAAWMLARRGDAEQGASELDKEQLRQARLRNDMSELKLGMQRGQILPREAARRDALGWVQTTVALLEQLSGALPLELVGRNLGEMQEIVQRHVGRLRAELALRVEGRFAEGQNAECRTQKEGANGKSDARRD